MKEKTQKQRKTKIVTLFIIILFLIILTMFYSKNNLSIINSKVINAEQMTDSSRITELEKQINNLNAEYTSYAEYVQTSKSKLATAITNEGISTSTDSTADTMASNISKILNERTKDATATTSDIAKGKTAYINGEKVTGNAIINSNVSNVVAINGTTYYHTVSSPIFTLTSTEDINYGLVVCSNGSGSNGNDASSVTPTLTSSNTNSTITLISSLNKTNSQWSSGSQYTGSNGLYVFSVTNINKNDIITVNFTGSRWRGGCTAVLIK